MDIRCLGIDLVRVILLIKEVVLFDVPLSIEGP